MTDSNVEPEVEVVTDNSTENLDDKMDFYPNTPMRIFTKEEVKAVVDELAPEFFNDFADLM